jgi:two-component system cell cycle sensor histidine kinase/response regulator CckA
MQDANKTKEQLIRELAAAHQRVAELEAQEVERRRTGFEKGAMPEAPQESERRFRAIFEQSPLGIGLTDSTTGHFLEANLKHCEIVGLTREEMLKTDFQTITHPDDLQADVDNMRRLVAGEIHGFNMEKRYIRPDGAIVWVNLTVVPMWEEGEPHARHLAMVEDITERKRAQEALERSEAQFRGLVERTSAGIATTDLEGRFTFVNAALCKMIGYSEEELIGSPFASFLHPDDVGRILELFRNASNDPLAELHLEFRVLHKKGHIVYCYSSPTISWHQGEIAGFNAIIYDITERKQAELVLKTAKDFTENLIQTANTIIVALDVHGNLQIFNQAAEEITGYTWTDLEGKNWFEVLAPKDRYPHVWEEFSRLLHGGLPIKYENPILTKSGEERYIVWRNNVIVEQGRIVGTISFGIDITERKRAEEALRASEQKFRSFVEQSSDGLVLVNEQGLIIEWNQARERMTGVKRDEALSRPFWEIQSRITLPEHRTPERLAYFKASLFDALRTGQSPLFNRPLEAEVVRPDGERRYIEQVIFPIKTDQGYRLGSVSRDITEQKRAESQREAALEALRATTANLETLIRVSPLAITLLDRDGNVQLWNPSAERIFAWTAQEVIGHPNPIVPAAQQAEYAIWSGQVLHGQALTDQETVRQRKDGSLVDVSISSAPVYDAMGNLAGRMAIVADITERKQAEEARVRLATAIDQAAESIVITDTAGAIQYVNPAFERTSGYSQAEALGQNPRLLKSGKQNLAFYEALWATITAGQVWQGRLVNRKKDGTLFTEDATISPVRDEGGAIVSYVAVKRDVTRELRLEEQYYQAQKLEAVGRLTAGVAHDFNNILTAINGFSELVSMGLAPDNPLQDSVKKVLGSGQRAAGLVRQLLAFSRKQVVQPVVLNLNDVMANLEKMLGRIIGEDVELHTIPAPGLWLTMADATQIEQVILNLAVNARDAMPNGGKLTIETANVTLDEAYAASHLGTRPGEYVLLAVSDTGAGMSDEVKSRLFEPFFTTKELGRGTGLGLATVYGIVKQGGGDIRVYSEEGLGTTFKVYLPRIGRAAAPAAPAPANAEMPAGRETVLLVEDDEAVRELARRVLRSLGYTLLEASDGQEALRLAAGHPGSIHLLLTDVVLPGMSGVDMAKQLIQARPGLKTLFMSGYTDNAIAHHGVLDPGIAFLQKPFGPMELARKVRAVLDAQP